MKPTYLIPMGLALSLLMTGCGRGTATPYMDRLDPTAPAASGLPATPGPDEPIPLGEGSVFGLYTEPPTSDTLAQLSTGKLSPDQRYRAAVTQQGIWVARVDAAWVWQVPLPQQPVTQSTQDQEEKSSDKDGETAEAEKSNQPTDTTGTTGAAQAPVQPPQAASVDWQAPSTLLIRDTRGGWWKANPDLATVTKMASPPAGQTKQGGQTSGQQGDASQPGAQPSAQQEGQSAAGQSGR